MAFPSSNLFLWHMKSPPSVPSFLCLPFLFNNLNLFYEIVNTLYKDIILDYATFWKQPLVMLP